MTMVAQQPPDFGAIVFGASATLTAHIGLIVLVLYAHVFGGEPEAPSITLPVMETELLMLGDVMPNPGEMPWIANPERGPEVDTNPEPAPVPDTPTALPDQETVVLNPPVEPPPETRREENRPTPEPQPRDAPERRDRGESNPNRPTNERPRMGSPDGVAGGTSLSAAAMANQLAGLTAQLGRAMRRPAAIPEGEYNQLTARVNVRVTVEGRITTWEFVDRSGNRLFDDAVDSMLNRFRMGSDRLRLNTVTNMELRNAIISSGFTVPVRAR